MKRPVRHPDICPSHPGELLREAVLPAVSLSKVEVARALGISRQTLYDILAEKQPVTPKIAIRLGHYFGNGPKIWLNMQTAHDIWHAERAVDLSKVKPLKKAG